MNRDRPIRPPRHSERPWQGRVLFLALAALIISLSLIASRDGITEVIPDLWASAGTIAHMFGASDWPFG
jgi:hypothetical protein